MPTACTVTTERDDFCPSPHPLASTGLKRHMAALVIGWWRRAAAALRTTANHSLAPKRARPEGDGNGSSSLAGRAGWVVPLSAEVCPRLSGLIDDGVGWRMDPHHIHSIIHGPIHSSSIPPTGLCGTLLPSTMLLGWGAHPGLAVTLGIDVSQMPVQVSTRRGLVSNGFVLCFL